MTKHLRTHPSNSLMLAAVLAAGLLAPGQLFGASAPASASASASRGASVRFHLTGSIGLPKGASRRQGCHGRVHVSLSKGKRILRRHDTSLNRRCRWHWTAQVSRARLGSARRLSERWRFEGNAILRPIVLHWHVRVPKQTPKPPTTTPTTTPTSPTIPIAKPVTHAEQEGRFGVNTFANYHNASGLGTKIAPFATVEVTCKVLDMTIQSVNPDGYWYRIASNPWDNAYYSPANTFFNGDPVGGPYTHNTDFAVPNC